VRVINPILISLAVILALAQLACGQTTSSNSKQDEWELLGSNAVSRFYRSTKSPERTSTGTVLTWAKIEFRSETPEGQKAQEKATKMTTAAMEGKPVSTVAYYLQQAEFDCAKNIYRNRATSLYDADGKVIESVPGEDNPEWKSLVAKGFYDVIREAVCK
jgi:hypothetical protein